MSDIKRLTKLVDAFRNARDWKQFHNPKDMALSLTLEAAEVLEHFQFLNAAEMAEHVRKKKTDIADELADVMYWVLLMAHDFGIDLNKAIPAKLRRHAKKYPVTKSKGRHTKYTEL